MRSVLTAKPNCPSSHLGRRLLQAAAGGLAWTIALGLVFTLGAGCGNSEAECSSHRSKAFEIINEAHTCNNDGDCVGSDWPGCLKPISSKNNVKLADLKKKFDEGKCTEPPNECKDAPDVYCKQGLCVFRHRAATK